MSRWAKGLAASRRPGLAGQAQFAQGLDDGLLEEHVDLGRRIAGVLTSVERQAVGQFRVVQDRPAARSAADDRQPGDSAPVSFLQA